MSFNSEIATIFNEMATVLELIGANRFRVNAHIRVARLLSEATTNFSTLTDDIKKLTALEGIGEASAKKIIEYSETGDVKEHKELLAQVPSGLFDVLNIQGLGPKTVKLMWEKAGVTDITTLKKALDAGIIEKLPRMGVKTVQNIRDSLEFAEKSTGRIRLGKAMPVAEAIIHYLKEVKGTQEIQFAGSLRRGKDTIGDIDILAATTKPEELADTFKSMEGVEKVLAAGDTKTSIRLEDGIQVDLRIVDRNDFGAALLYFSGSKEHNIVLRERAIKRKLRLNEYGLFQDDGLAAPQKRGIKPVASKTEEDVYQKLDLPWIPPEIREDKGECNTDIPVLLELSDIKAELHAHTVASDGRISIEELANEAKSRGFHTIAVTDHSKSSVQANGLSPDRLREHIEAIREADQKIKGINILAGSEVDILSDGRLDYEDDLLAELDIVVASPHVALKQDSSKATARLITAIKHPLVHILGHPTGRLINKREGLNPDINALVEAAVEHDTALEINANFLRLDLRDIHVKVAVNAGAKIAINTDAHSPENFDYLRYGVLTARRGWLTANDCINTWPKQKLHKWLKSKR